MCRWSSSRSSGEDTADAKVITLLKRKAGMTREEFSRYWREVHATVALDSAGSRQIRRYVMAVGLVVATAAILWRHTSRELPAR